MHIVLGFFQLLRRQLLIRILVRFLVSRPSLKNNYFQVADAFGGKLDVLGERLWLQLYLQYRQFLLEATWHICLYLLYLYLLDSQSLHPRSQEPDTGQRVACEGAFTLSQKHSRLRLSLGKITGFYTQHLSNPGNRLVRIVANFCQ